VTSLSERVWTQDEGLDEVEASEVFGGNATSREYPVEKLLRDARMGTIAGGTNAVLSLIAASSTF